MRNQNHLHPPPTGLQRSKHGLSTFKRFHQQRSMGIGRSNANRFMNLTKPVLRYAEEPDSSPFDPALRRTSETGLGL
jgi:hypothetical protein